MHYAVRRRVPEDDIRDQLLEAWILLHLRPWSIADMFAGEQGLKVPIDVGAKALKIAELAKTFRGHNEDLFYGDRGHARLLSKRGATSVPGAIGFRERLPSMVIPVTLRSRWLRISHR
jgi:hypothetical protein